MSLRVLVVDDDQAFAHMLKRTLVRHGMTVHETHDSTAALACIQANTIDAVLLDLMLGDESGLLLIEPMLMAHPEVRIVVLTGYASIPTTVQALKLGAHNYLAKPVGAHEVIAALEGDEVASNHDMTESKPMSLKRLEWEHIQRVLAEHDGNVSATADSLGMHRRSLQRKLFKKPPNDG